jgi:hypothetical protein
MTREIPGRPKSGGIQTGSARSSHQIDPVIGIAEQREVDMIGTVHIHDARGRTELIGTLAVCPQMDCQAPASVTEVRVLPSTKGPHSLAKIVGSCGHWFTIPVDQVQFAS